MRPLLPLLAGLALGTAATFSLRYFASASHPPQPAPSSERASPAPPVGPAVTLVPPTLPTPEAVAALDAFLALPALASDAVATEVEERLARLQALLTLLPPEQLSRLIAALDLRTGDAEARLRRAAFAVWIDTDAPAAARWAAAITPGEAINVSARNRYVQQAALAWARTDFDAAYAWIQTLPSELAQTLPGPLLNQLAATDPQRALGLARAAGEEFFRRHQTALFRSWAENDPASAIRALGSTLLETSPHDWTVRQALVKWMDQDTRSAFAWMIAQATPDDQFHRSLLHTVSNNPPDDPKTLRALAALLTEHQNVPGTGGALRNLFGSWSRRDPASALAWLDTLPDPAQRSDFVARSLGYIDHGKPDAFLDLVRRLPTSEVREQAIADRLASWSKVDPDAAIAWLGKHDSPEFTLAAQRVESTLLASLATSDPAAASSRWTALPAGPEKTAAAHQLARAWAKKDPAAAAQWLGTTFDEKSSDHSHESWQAVQQVGARWGQNDPLAMLDWAATLPNPTLREAAIHSITQPYWPHDEERPDPPPRAARADTLARIEDPALRERVLTQHLKNWLSSDVNAARTWIESHNALSPEKAAELLTTNTKN